MSRAFVTKDAGPDCPNRPDCPDRLDKLPKAAAARDIPRLGARLQAAVMIDPAAPVLTEPAFGLVVPVAGPDGTGTGTGTGTTSQIIGADKADATRHRLAPTSPPARALLGARLGDAVTSTRPAGPMALEVIRIAHADP